MDDTELEVTWKGKETTLVLREEGDEIKGYVGKKKHVLTVVWGDEDELTETYCHEDLEYDFDELVEALEEDEDEEDEDEDEEEDEDDEEEDEDEEDEDEEDEDEDEDEEEDEEEEDEAEGGSDEGDDSEIDEDEDADYGDPVKSANIPGVPTLHAVIVGYGAEIGVDADVRLYRELFRTLQAEKILNVRETLLTGADATAENALARVKALRPAADDVVWFAYSGHGAMDPDGDRLLCTRGKMLRRAAVSEAMKKVGGRFAVTLSDCCANECGRVPAQEKLGAARSGNTAARLKKLFRTYRGHFDVTSSSDYQYSYGGVFTPSLIKKVILGSAEDTWSGVMERTTKLTMAEGEGAMSREGRRALQKAGQRVIDAQKPVAYSMPDGD